MKTLFTVGEELAGLVDSNVPSLLADKGGANAVDSVPISPTTKKAGVHEERVARVSDPL